MASFTLPTIRHPSIFPKSSFLGKFSTTQNPPSVPQQTHRYRSNFSPTAKFQLFEFPGGRGLSNGLFQLFEFLGGRGLCNGEEGLQKELKSPKQIPIENPSSPPSSSDQSPSPSPISIGEGAFEKELLGLTGGFPGGEKGLIQFIEKNPPPPKKKTSSTTSGESGSGSLVAKKQKAPELPLLLPGMIVIVKNKDHPFHMYCGIVQRVTDGRVGVLFEGGNWDKLMTFRIDELERREKGPPMVNPKSAILEEILEKQNK